MIRPAERKDVPRIWELINELADYEKLTHAVTGSAEALEKHIFDNKICWVNVYELDGIVIGYTLCFTVYSTFRTQPGLWMEDLYVTPLHRGKGYGKALITFLIEYCRENNLGRLEWSVLDWNISAIRFYESMGATLLEDWRMCRISF